MENYGTSGVYVSRFLEKLSTTDMRSNTGIRLIYITYIRYLPINEHIPIRKTIFNVKITIT